MPFLLDELLDLVFPIACALCGAAGATLCPACVRLVAGPPGPVPPSAPGAPPCWSAGPYAGAARDAILAYKERGRQDLAAPLGAVLGGVVLAAAGPARQIALVPVPSTPGAVRARGADHVRRLAEVASRRVRGAGVPCVVVPALRVAARREDSVGLGAAARRHNVSGTMAVRIRRLGRVGSAKLVLVDDLVTTGSTLAEAARALAMAGHTGAPAAAVLVATELRHSSGMCEPAGSG